MITMRRFARSATATPVQRVLKKHVVDYVIHEGPFINAEEEQKAMQKAMDAITSLCRHRVLYWCVVGFDQEGDNLIMRVFSSGLEWWPRVLGLPEERSSSEYEGTQNGAQQEVSRFRCGHFFVRGPKRPAETDVAIL
ncbi:hypothetical protein JDV02_008326 [Purpureocillium takamizusanense]|uniref:Uncharacterized protein n=1 Tax=Purpureocillium takamizusanense TaxID=2060973 RepID=A0A9Q8QNF7_9HYPO|nr:uncharacterized protein JDV02_008326 [Purpureocillium takamizusanense]UNI22437.1 hypothetical protein JDV02_008326 [Purpureocillium takamizusanense]